MLYQVVISDPSAIPAPKLGGFLDPSCVPLTALHRKFCFGAFDLMAVISA